MERAAPPDLTGQTLGDFHVLRRLGQGGMGQVYLAEQRSLKRKVALKIMRPELAANPVALKRFKAEAERVARLTHANIVQIYAIGEANGLHYMALEYVEGRNLRDFVAKKGPPDLLLALSIMRQTAAALQRASEAGIVHRDIKPENILLTRNYEVKVTDFGLSRCFAGEPQPVNLTQSGVTMGTPLYMSPEQVQGQEVDPRSDIYSLGVTCWHMLAGEPPFRGQTAFEVALQHVQKEPPLLSDVRPDLPAELVAIVHKMMAKRPEDRYASCRDLLLDLTRLRESLSGTQGVLGQLPAAGPPPAWAASSGGAPAAIGGRRRVWLLGTLVALALGAGLGWVYRSRVHAPTPHQQLEPWSALPESDASRERALRAKLQTPVDPNDPAQLKAALYDRIELGLFLIQQNRLRRADDFFAGLIQNPEKIEAYTVLGYMGHAMVLAFQDRTKESNLLFLQLVRERLKRGMPGSEEEHVLLQHPQWRVMLACALERNARNATAADPFPKPLEPLRRLPGLTPKEKGPTRPAGTSGP